MRRSTVYTNKKENIAGFVYIFVQIYIFPTILTLINGILPTPLSSGAVNFIFFAINFICIAVIFRRFLLTSFQTLTHNFFIVLRFAFIGFLIYQISTFAMGILVIWLCPEFSNLNDNALIDSVAENYTLMSIGTILLAPVAEEVLYRGVVFGSLHKHNPILAYVISTIVFSLIHIVGYIHLYEPLALLCSFLAYVPAGLSLAWAYTKSGNIIAPILIHIAVNQLGILYLR